MASASSADASAASTDTRHWSTEIRSWRHASAEFTASRTGLGAESTPWSPRKPATATAVRPIKSRVDTARDPRIAAAPSPWSAGQVSCVVSFR
jgi:hypothetical protein